MDPICLTVTLLHDYCTQTYINIHKLFTLYYNFICVLSGVIIKTDDDDDDDDGYYGTLIDSRGCRIEWY